MRWFTALDACTTHQCTKKHSSMPPATDHFIPGLPNTRAGPICGPRSVFTVIIRHRMHSGMLHSNDSAQGGWTRGSGYNSRTGCKCSGDWVFAAGGSMKEMKAGDDLEHVVQGGRRDEVGRA